MVVGGAAPLDPLAAALGPARAAELREELAAAGHVPIAIEELAELDRSAAAFQRLRRLAEPDDS